ncbi:MAG: DUF3971 domain-containing protein [Rhodospirillales bacterium]|nr:DUF3971 domain-containing protein [Rhodospirillales bacterium]
MHVVGGLGVGMAVVLGVIAWRLSTGPISLGFMNPYVETALSSKSDAVKVEIADTILTWAGWQRNLDIRVLGVHVTGPDGATIGDIPELSLSLSAAALMSGQLAPRTIEVFGAGLRLQRELDGSFLVGFANAGEGQSRFRLIDRILGDILAKPNPDRPLSYLKRVRVVNGDMAVYDRLSNTSWRAPGTEIVLTRERDGIRGEMTSIIIVDEHRLEVGAVGSFNKQTRRTDFGVDIFDANPAALAKLSPELDFLQFYDGRVSGTLTGTMTSSWLFESASFDLSVDAGRLVLPGVTGKGVEVREGVLRGRLAGGAGNIAIEDFSLVFGKDAHVDFPAPLNHKFPVRKVSGRLFFYPGIGRVEADLVNLDLGGPTAAAHIEASDQGADGFFLELRGAIRNVMVDDAALYWPSSLGADAHAWVTTHLSEGKLDEAQVEGAVKIGREGEIDIVSATGTMNLSGVTVDYLPPMPKARNLGGHVRFDRKKIDINILGGQSAGMALREGTVILSGLDAYDQYADIDLTIEGPIRNALKIIDGEPLGFASVVGIKPENASGQSVTRLSLDFLLEKALTFEGVGVTASSTLQDVSLANVVLGLDMSEGRLDLNIDRNGMDVGGKVKLGTIPVAMRWRENFTGKAPFKSRYSLHGAVSETQLAKEVGLAFPPFTGGYVSGSMDAGFVLTEYDGRPDEMTATLDLMETSLNLPLLDWRKESGVAGRAEVEMKLKARKVLEVSRVDVEAGDLIVRGSVSFDKKTGSVRRINLDRLSQGRTDISGIFIPGKGRGWDADVTGAGFDLTPIRKNFFDDEVVTPENPGDSFPPVTVSFRLDNVWLGSDQDLTRVSGAFAHENRTWKNVVLDALIGDGKTFRVLVEPKGNKRSLLVTSEDAGETLRVFDLFPNMEGGSLEITGEYDDTHPDSPLSGMLLVRDYRMVKAPLLAHILNIAALTGALDSLGGRGLAFQTLEVPFQSRPGEILITDAKATGTSIGLTASGRLYTYADFVDLEGTIVPIYALNSLFGRIPVLGDILTGGEEGGGIFAANYKVSGSIEKPEVTVNPLSALAPGFFRNLFKIGDSDGSQPGVVPSADPVLELPKIN